MMYLCNSVENKHGFKFDRYLKVNRFVSCDYIFLLMLAFLCTILPYVELAGFAFPIFIIPYIFLISIYILNGQIEKIVLCSFIVSSIVFVVAVLIGLSKQGVFSFRLLELALFFPVLMTSARSFVLLCRRKYEPIFLYTLLINAVVINSIFVVLLNVGLINADVFYSIIHTDPKVFSYPIVRYPGFSYDAFSYLSVLNAFCLCLLFDLYFNNYLRSRIYIAFCCLFLLAAVVVSGRTGIVIILCYFLFKLATLNIKAFKVMALSFFALGFLFMLDWGPYEWYKEWSFAFIGRIFSGDGRIDSSVSGVASHIFLPENLLIGDGIGFLEVRSDLGFIRMINSSGVIGSIGFLLYYAFFFFVAVVSGRFFSFFSVAMLFVLNIKDVYFISPYGHTFFVLVAILSNYPKSINGHRKHELG